MAKDDDIKQEREDFERAAEAEADNRMAALEDLRFARLGEQWPDAIRRERELEGRPILTINRMPSFIRQVVNDSRQNKPQIKVKPADDKADKATANIFAGIIRSIEHSSKADIAYDTAVDFAASMGFGYIRVAIDYAYDDSFDKTIVIQRVANPFSVYGDPDSTEADSSDWNRAFVTDLLTKEEFRQKYKGAEAIDWDTSGYSTLNAPWVDGESIMVCESWKREAVMRKILLLSDGSVKGEAEFKAGFDYFSQMGLTPVQERMARSYKITQRIMTGAEVLEENEWSGRYIPIIPVYGEELNIEGKRHFRSLVRDAKDAQRMFNYWRSTATELVALAPRVAYIGEEGSFDVEGEAEKWATANQKSWPFLQHKRGTNPPQRQPLDTGSAAGALTEAMQASDDMKSIMGLYDASLGQRSNEVSGRAINARKLEGDTSTFHFIDNLSRAIRHVGCVCVDLIPKVLSGEQMIRIIGDDGKPDMVKIGQRPEGQPAEPPKPTPEQKMAGDEAKLDVGHVYDLSVGRYDVVVDTGPSYTTMREETASQMTEFMRSFPAAVPVVGDLLVENLDWKNADKIAERLKAMLPAQATGGMPPELQQMIEGGKQQIADQGEQIKALEQQIQQSQATSALEQKAFRIALDKKDLEIRTLKALEAIDDAAEKHSGALTPQPAERQSPAVSVNVPDNLAENIAPIIGQAVAQAMASMPPMRVEQPPPVRMRRIPIRDRNGLIIETRDEPIEEVMN